MALLASETWTGTDGSPWPAQWTTGADTATGAAVDINGNRGRLVTTSTGTFATGNYALLSGMTPTVDFDITFDLTFASTAGAYHSVWARVESTGWGTYSNPANGYRVTLVSNGDVILRKQVAGTSTDLLTTNTGAITANVARRVRYQGIGSVFQAKVWDPAGAEPATWNGGSVTDTSVTAAGRVGVKLFNGGAGGNQATYLDNLTVESPIVVPAAPTPAPTPPAPRTERRLAVSVYTGSYSRVGQVPQYVSCSATWDWLGVGAGELVVGEDDPVASYLLQADEVPVLVVIGLGTTRWSGRVDSAVLERQGPPGSGVVTATLVDDWIWLQRMLASQNGASSSLASMPQYDTRTGPAVSVAADFINAAATRLGVPVVASKPATDTSPTVTLKARMTPLADLLTDALKQAGVTMTAQVWLPGDTQPPDLSTTLTTPTIVFHPQVLADKPWLQWTDSMTNIVKIAFKGKQPLAYRTVVGLSGTDAARIYDQVIDTTRQTGVGAFGLPEIYTDATDAALGSQSAAAGIEALMGVGGSVSISFDINDGEPFRFGEDYVIGDMATAVVSGASWRQRISKLTVEDTRSEGLVITPVIGEQSDVSGDDMMVQALARVAQGVRALQAGR